MLKLICQSHQTIYLGKELDTAILEETYDYKFYVGRLTAGTSMTPNAMVSVITKRQEQITEQSIRINAKVKLKSIDTTIRLLAVRPSPNQAMEIECVKCGEPNLVETHLYTLDSLWRFDAPETVLIHQTRKGIAKRGTRWNSSQNLQI